MTKTMDQASGLREMVKGDSLGAFRQGIPGVYEEIPADIYHTLDAASASRLKQLARSPLHCRHSIDHPNDDESDVKELGTCGHACILEPDDFQHAYAIGPDVDLRTKAGKETWAAFEASNAGRFLVRGKDGEKLAGMHKAVWAHPAAIKALNAPGPRELSIVWRDERSRMLCKLRADHAPEGIVWDVKTTQDASPEGFAWSIRKYGYDRQAAFYLRGFAAAGMMREGFGFIAVESTEPHAVAVYTLSDQDLATADDEVFGAGGLLDEYAECVRSGEWAGYSNKMTVLRLPLKRRDAIVA